MSEITRYPEWLRRAFGLADPELPTHVETNTGVLPIVDVNAPDWLAGSHKPLNIYRPGGNAAETYYLSSAGGDAGGAPVADYSIQEQWHGLLYLSGFLIGGATSMNVSLRLMLGASSVDPVYIGSAVVAPDSALTHRNIVGDHRPFYLPPGSQIALAWDAVPPAATSWEVKMLYRRFPSGSRLLFAS